ncbi:eukaryotic translation initiation factor 3 subunit A isoform X2 [Biomphalaria glabrata]|nr:eukaryotic translation initiation factor 3 subunit A isoform X2 [Biomphalaria glabrata]
MPTYFQKPENALKRADEFIDVGKKQRALDALYDVIKSKKHRTWQKTHEPIMEKYLELCVELRKSHIAKEGLYQYKNICQQVNISSLVEVVKNYIALAEEKTEAARKESHQTVVDIDDLDLPDSPESLLLKAVSGEDLQDRTDRAILTPWVKFLWESYRQCLDLLRNNSRVERLYQDIAQQAFKFCLKYSRKTEFRKLCDNLRTHLGHIHKHQHQQTAINLNNPESQAMHLETRLVQLDSAISMELWQEAFKAVEDIHGLITLSKKQPKPSLMANYYQKLGLVFSKSGNHLFHACTLHRLFNLSREQRKNLSSDELQKMASRVLCATLAIPIPPTRNVIGNLLVMDESTIEKQRKLATLLMLQTPPTRQSLVKDLVKHGSIQYAYQELQNLYQSLEVDFHPLSLYKKVKPIVDFIEQSEDLSQYVPQLEDIIITRVLKQIAQVYQQIKLSRFASLVPFASEHRLESVIVDAAKTLELQVRIDHRSRALSFGTDLGVSQKEDLPEGPYIQSMPSEQIRNQVINIAQALNQAVDIIGPKESTLVEEDELKAQILNTYRLTAKKEHARILQRRQIIENRKEQLEQNQDQREREEQELAEEQRRKTYEAEMARLEREAEERNKQRQLEEHEQIKKRHVKERLEELRKTPHGSKILQNIDEEEIAELDVDEIMAKQVEQLEKEKKELQERLKGQEKKVDYLARAKRIEEIPLLQDQYEEDQKARKAFWEEQEKERIESTKLERAHALETKARLILMKSDLDTFTNSLKKAKKSEYEDKLKDFEKLLSEERRKRLQERKIKRKEERRQKWIQEKEEAAQRARDELLKREREEKEREEQEKREAEERVYLERKAKLDEQLIKQRAKEKEIEEREAKRREEERKQQEIKPSERVTTGRENDADWRGDSVPVDESERKPKSRSWREREVEKENSQEIKPLEKRVTGRDMDSDWRNDSGTIDESEGKTKPRSWREREMEKENSWKSRKDPEAENWRSTFREPPRESWRERHDDRRDDRGPQRDDRRDDRGPQRDDRRDDRGPQRDDRRDDRGPQRDDWRGGDKQREAPLSRGSWRARDDSGPQRVAHRDNRDSIDERKGADSEVNWRRGFESDDKHHDRDERIERDDRRGLDRSDRRTFDREDRLERDDRRGADRIDRRTFDRDDRIEREDRRGFDRSDRRTFDREDRKEREDRRVLDRPDRITFDRDDRRAFQERRAPIRDDRHVERTGPPVDDRRGPIELRERDEGWRRGDVPRDVPSRVERRNPRENSQQHEDDGWTTVRY